VVPEREPAALGLHFMYDMSGVKVPGDERMLGQCLWSAARAGGMTVVKVVTHAFSPHGLTGVAVVAESHIAVHTWPEHDFLALDVFWCGGGGNAAAAAVRAVFEEIYQPSTTVESVVARTVRFS